MGVVLSLTPLRCEPRHWFHSAWRNVIGVSDVTIVRNERERSMAVGGFAARQNEHRCRHLAGEACLPRFVSRVIHHVQTMTKAKSRTYLRIRAEVLRLVRLIPAGKFTTYGSIAVHMNVVALHVGSVLSSLTEEEAATMPWHRVVSSDGRLSTKMGAELSKVQRARLEGEGLKIDPRGFIQDADAHFHVVGIRRNIRWSEG